VDDYRAVLLESIADLRGKVQAARHPEAHLLVALTSLLDQLKAHDEKPAMAELQGISEKLDGLDRRIGAIEVTTRIRTVQPRIGAV